MAAKQLNFHPLSMIFPALTDAQQNELNKDVKSNDLLDPIVLYEGMILDGRHRQAACNWAGVKPRYIEYEGNDPEGFVRSKNAVRRQMTDNERLLVETALAVSRQERLASEASLQSLPASRKGANQHGEKLLPQAEVKRIAEETGVSERKVRAAASVLDSCSLGVQEAVKAGDVTVADAEAVADLPKLEQMAALKAVRAGKARSLAAAAGVKPSQKITGKKAAKQPERNKQPVGTFASVEKLIGQLAREIDKVAHAHDESTGSNRVRSIQSALGQVKCKVIEWKEAKQ